jgi:hypothetical protein
MMSDNLSVILLRTIQVSMNKSLGKQTIKRISRYFDILLYAELLLLVGFLFFACIMTEYCRLILSPPLNG